jgi:ABC-type bacteriocin/lantibiotic exporter with double-glycine peptidase domain
MEAIRKTTNKPAQIVTKTVNNLIIGFVRWAFSVSFTIIIVSFICALITYSCHFDSDTIALTRKNMSTGFKWWSTGLETFRGLIEQISNILY